MVRITKKLFKSKVWDEKQKTSQAKLNEKFRIRNIIISNLKIRTSNDNVSIIKKRHSNKLKS